MTKNLSESQRKNRNDKKRLQDLYNSIQRYKDTGERIVLKKAPTDAMDIMARKHGINVYDFYHGTISPVEQDRRRREYNTKQRNANKREAIKERGVYKGTGEQTISRTQEQEDFFNLPPEEQWEAHKKVQARRDILRGWNCPICRKMVPIDDEVTKENEGDIIVVKKIKGDKSYPFTFHADCYAGYLLAEHNKMIEKSRTVHQVNTSKELIKNYKNWKKKGDKI